MRAFLLRAWFAAASFAVWAWCASGLYRLKSRIYRRLWEAKYLASEIVTFDSLDAMAVFVREGTLWRADGWRSGWDAVGTPGRAQAAFAGAEPAGTEMDCDEHAIFVVASSSASLRAGKLARDGVANPRFFTVTWMNRRTGAPDGHNVALFEVPQDAGRPPLWCFMDYGNPSAHYRSIEGVALAVIAAYADGPSTLLAWCVQLEDLTPVDTRRGSLT